MAVGDTDKLTVLCKVRDWLINGFSEFNESTCFVTTTPEPSEPPPATADKRLFVTIAPGAGSFEIEQQIGGGAEAAFYQGSIAVTIFVLNRKDKIYHDTQFVADVLRWEARILKRLVGFNPKDAEGNDLLTQDLYVIRDDDPRRESVHKTGDLMLIFGADFNWSL